jgi:LmbE family N-acetylglucosaminyl deacetylase
MNVESLWLAHEHVNWETGEPDRGGDDEGPGNHSHCSAFAAAAAKRLGVYLLRPPEHGQLLLANAQAAWLSSAAAQKLGWASVSDMREAQRLANQGDLVVVLFQNPDKHVPGHIAIVRPSEKSLKALREHGPRIIMAGNHNYASTNVRFGFQNHPGAWPDGVLYYVHRLPR